MGGDLDVAGALLNGILQLRRRPDCRHRVLRWAGLGRHHCRGPRHPLHAGAINARQIVVWAKPSLAAAVLP